MNPLSLEIKLAILGVLVAVFAGMAWGVHYYHNKYEVEHAAFEGFKAQVAALGEQAKQHKVEVEAKDKLAKEKEDALRTERDQKITAGWNADRAELGRVRAQLADSRSRAVSAVTVGAGLSCDAASREAVSGAVSKYVAAARQALDECRAAAIEFRENVARQLEQADLNTSALMCGIGWAAKTATPETPAALKPPKGFFDRILGR